MSTSRDNSEIPPGFHLRHTLQRHQSQVFRLAWSPDGKLLATPSYDRTICLWDAETGQLVRTLTGHTQWVASVSWSPDGTMLASASGDMTVRIWDVLTGTLRYTMPGHSNNVYSVAWSPDGSTIASASTDMTIRLWNAQTGELDQRLAGHSSVVACVAWSPDGELLASGSDDRTIRLWNIATGEFYRQLTGHTNFILSLAWLPNTHTLVSAAEDIQLWDITSGQQTTILRNKGSVTCISVSCDGRFLASKSAHGTVQLWRCDTWERVAFLYDETSYYLLDSLAFHPTKSVLATIGTKNSEIRIWDLDFEQLTINNYQ